MIFCVGFVVGFGLAGVARGFVAWVSVSKEDYTVVGFSVEWEPLLGSA